MSRLVDRRACLVAAGAALVLGLAATPALADTVPGSPVGVGAVRNGSRDMVFATVWTDTPGATVASVTAELRHGSDSVPVALDGSTGEWRTPRLELQSDGGTMPVLGRYAVDVTATDTSGNTTTRTDAGTLDFTLTPQFAATSTNDSLTYAPTSVSVSAHTTAVSGQLLGLVPGSGRTIPLPDQDVTVTETDAGAQRDTKTVVTGTDGTFATAAFDQDDRASYTATVTVDEPDAHGSLVARSGGPGIVATPLTLTATSSPALVAAGQHFVVSGDLRATPDGPGFAAATVQVTDESYPNAPQCTTQTDANGHFTCSMTAIGGTFDDSWSAAVVPPPFTYTLATPSGTVQVADESAYSGVHITLAANGTVTATGTLTAPYDPNTELYNPDTRLEYSADGHTGWTLIGHGSPQYSGTAFTVAGPARLDNAFYRVHHLLSNTLSEAVGPVVHLHRVDTRIVGNDATPEPIRAGATITVSGALQQYVGGWRVAPGQVVDLYFYVRGARTRTFLTAGRTDSHGRIALHAKAVKDGYWELHYFGDAAHFDGYATPDYVDVR